MLLSMNIIRKLLIISISVLVLTSCGGDGIGGTGYPHTDLSVRDGALYRSTEDSLSTYFQKSVIQRNENPTKFQNENGGLSQSAGAPSVSSTNIQEAGVEEADLIKTNGATIYSVSKSNFNDGKKLNKSALIRPEDAQVVSTGIIRIMEPEGSGLKEVKRITKEGSSFSGLYLHNESNRLVALSSNNQHYYSNWFDSAYFANQNTDVMFIDVEDAESASIVTTLSFDGSLISSRRNGDTMYLVLRHYPDYQYVDEPKLLGTTTKDFLPMYNVDGKNNKLITKAENCFLEKGSKESSDIISIVAIDLKSVTPEINSRCFVGSAEAFYASQESLFLATTRWDYEVRDGISIYPSAKITTDIHKFSYSALDLDYRGSGEVNGHLGNNQDSKSFRFSESQGMLRVVTFDEDQWAVLPVDEVVATADIEVGTDDQKENSPVSLTILKENTSSKTLDVISKLPNADRPQPIGLPGEHLYATRFIGDRAYIVTFRVTDPLYVLDVSNPDDPFIAGELKVDGYSDYLHPIGENLLLGIGKDAIPDESALDERGAWYQGVKLSLIDVSSPSNPQEVDKITLGKRGTETAVLFDHHAFTGLNVDNKFRVAIPVRYHENKKLTQGEDIASTFHAYKQLGLYRFEVDLESQKIVAVPAMIIENRNTSDNFPDIFNDRSVFINNNVHYMHNGSFWSQNWQGTNTILGPE